MVVLSGDQTGRLSRQASLVRRVGAEPSAFITYLTHSRRLARSISWLLGIV
jgi:hypothetical protein